MKIEPLSARTFPALKRLAEDAWRRPRSDAYYQWRYFDAPGLTTWVAMDGEQCVATISAFERRYRHGEQACACLEPFDWYTQAAARSSGVGLRLMKKLMGYGKAIIGLGGSDQTLQILPRLGFHTLAQATQFTLPLSARYLLRRRRWPLARQVVAPLMNGAVRLWFEPAKGAARFDLVTGASLQGHYAAPPEIFGPEPEPRFHEWLASGHAIGARTGRYLPLAILLRGEQVAWSLGRLYRSGGLLHGAVVDVRLKRPDEELAESAVRGMARLLARSGADCIRSHTSSPLLADAYGAAGFRAGRQKLPVMLWSGKHRLDIREVALPSIADLAFLPMEELAAEQPVALAAVARPAAAPGQRPAGVVRRRSVAAGLNE